MSGRDTVQRYAQLATGQADSGINSAILRRWQGVKVPAGDILPAAHRSQFK